LSSVEIVNNAAVSDCCSPAGYRWLFSEKLAHREAKRYERRGLDRTSRRIVELLTRRDIEGRTLLEVGGGVGALQIELLKRGIARAMNIEITPTYEAAAGALLRSAGLEDRVDRKVMDFAEAGNDVEAADIVIMNRVLCCYPDMPKLTAMASAHCREVMALSFPKDRRWTRTALTAANLLMRVTRRHFQVFVHRPERILAVAEQHGLLPGLNQPGRFWQVAELRKA
jgi:2-polyprenyl-3-methyl-5-hydroxy-6-metoxy-1,4-benzoquinol methylase